MIRAIVVDDEWAASGNLVDLLTDSGGVEVVGEFVNAAEALAKVPELQFELAFLDIEMPGMDGLTLANRILDIAGDVGIVFVTAYNDYAVEAFELNAVDYLLKPVTPERLRKTLDRVPIRHREASRRKPPLKVGCFGKFRVECGDGSFIKWRTSKTEEMCAYLIDQDDKWVGKDKLLEVLWSDFDRQRALTNFNTCLYNMRKTFGELGRPGLLLCENGMYRLDMAEIRCDVHRFGQCVADMEGIDGRNRHEFEEVVECCGGGYMEQNYYEWAEAKRRLLEEAYVQLIIRLANYYGRSGRELKAADTLKKGLAQDQVHSGLNYALIRMYLQMNDRVSARKQYDIYKRMLGIEYGMKPERELEQLLGD